MSRRILVVEDQPDNRQILFDLLTSVGYEIISAEDGEAGVAAATAERPDLILMDIQLPILDGYEATRRIKADPTLRAIPIIVVTSYALSGDEGKARAAGCARGCGARSANATPMRWSVLSPERQRISVTPAFRTASRSCSVTAGSPRPIRIVTAQPTR